MGSFDDGHPPRPPDDLVDGPGETYDPRDRGSASPATSSAAPSREQPTEFQGAGAGASPSRNTLTPEKPRYRFRRVVGQGGMGEVWEATQSSLGRTVAVKRILSSRHTDDKIEAARGEFRLEAVITAQLEHPNIVPVHDLVEDASGEPLIAMKLVGGEDWSRLCDSDFRTLAAADYLGKHLPVLVDVGYAAAFAHSRGIVHRDIKLSQVMIGEYGEVLLMDWGLAIRVDDEIPGDGEPTSPSLAPGRAPRDSSEEIETDLVDLPTRITARSPTGTPALMAPEQTRDTAEGVGRWTDVYLLGGCLYRLLTGTYPHHAASGKEAFELATTGEIEPPSVRTPDREIPGELEALCLEALSPAPGGRPTSAMAFVERLQDFLSGAGRRRESEALTDEVARILKAGGRNYDSFSDCLTRLDRAVTLWGQNPAAAGLRDGARRGWSRLALDGGDLALARLQAEQIGDQGLRAGVLTDVEAAENLRRRRESQRKLALSAVAALLVIVVLGSLEFTRRIAVQRDLAVAARDEAERQEDITFESLEGTSSLVNYMLGSLRHRLDLEREKDREVAAAVGEGVFDYYRQVDSSEFSTELAVEHAGQLTEVGKQFSDLGLVAESIELLEKAVEVLREQDRLDDPGAAETMVQLAHSNERLARWDEALGWLDRAEVILEPRLEEDPEALARALRTRGLVLKGMAEYDESETAYRRAYGIVAGAYGEDDPRIRGYSWALGDMLHDMGRPDEAVSYLERALRFAEDDPGERRLGLFEVSLTMAHVRSQQQEFDEAIEFFQRAIDIATEEFGPDDRLVGMCLIGLGNAYKTMDDYDRAEALIGRGVAIFESFYPPDHHEIGIALGAYAAIQTLRGNYEGAVRNYRRSIEIVTKTQGPYHKNTAVMHGELATTYSKMGRLEQSREEYLRAVDALEGGVGLDTFGAGVLFNNLALVEKKLGRYDESADHFRRSLEILTPLAGPEHGGLQQIRLNYADLLSNRGHSEEALAMIDDVVAIRHRTRGPDHPEVAKALMARADELVRLGRLDDAELDFREALRIRRESYGEAHELTAKSVRSLAALLADLDRHEEAIELQRTSLDAFVTGPGEDDGRTGSAHDNLGRSLEEAGRTQEALDEYETALAICRRAYGEDHPETLAVMGNVGDTLVALGRREEAETYLVVAYEARKAVAGGPDTGVARSALKLARLRSAQGDREAAIALTREALGFFETVLGEDHEETVKCREELAELANAG